MTIRSDITRYVPGCRGRPPETWISSVPAPVTLAPRACKKPCNSTISGSLAALQMRVSPAAPQAASMAFSVAPTLGKGSDKRRPASLAAVRRRCSPRVSTWAPRA